MGTPQIIKPDININEAHFWLFKTYIESGTHG